ncbi:MAG: hypothetical protein AAF191_17490, partial [Verrucomicrobiota bacterium]
MELIHHFSAISHAMQRYRLLVLTWTVCLIGGPVWAQAPSADQPPFTTTTTYETAVLFQGGIRAVLPGDASVPESMLNAFQAEVREGLPDRQRTHLVLAEDPDPPGSIVARYPIETKGLATQIVTSTADGSPICDPIYVEDPGQPVTLYAEILVEEATQGGIVERDMVHGVWECSDNPIDTCELDGGTPIPQIVKLYADREYGSFQTYVWGDESENEEAGYFVYSESFLDYQGEEERVDGCECQSVEACYGSVRFRVPLGRGPFLNQLGQLSVHQFEPGEHLFSPYSIELSLPRDVLAVRRDDWSLEKVISGNQINVIEMLPQDGAGYEIRSYHLDVDPNNRQLPTADMQPEGEPFRVVKVTNPRLAEGRFDQLQFEEILNGQTNQKTIYTWEEDQQIWSLISEGRKYSRTERTDPQTGLIVQRSIDQPLDGTAPQVREVHLREDAWGREQVVKSIVDPDGQAQTTVFDWHTDAEDQARLGKLKNRLNPDGSWVRFEY